MQKVLNLLTITSDLRSAADGWVAEDGDLIKKDKEIGLSESYKGFYCYKTPMHAIADGWELLAPPSNLEYDGLYSWWFVKD
jgi:hypothetical protein